jgi:hypothetical protein
MVILVLTKQGYKELEAVIASGKYPIWIGANVLSEKEIRALREEGIDLTDFRYSIDPESREDLDCALETIREHHPDQRIWAEHQPKI